MSEHRSSEGMRTAAWQALRNVRGSEYTGRASQDGEAFEQFQYALDPSEGHLWVVDPERGRIQRIGLNGEPDSELDFSDDPLFDFARVDQGWQVEAIATRRGGQLLICMVSKDDHPGTPRASTHGMRHRLLTYGESLDVLDTRDFLLPDTLAPLVSAVVALDDGSLIVESEDVVGNAEVQALTRLDDTGVSTWSVRRTGDQAPPLGDLFAVAGTVYVQQPAYAMDGVVVVKRVDDRDGRTDVVQRVHGRLLLGLAASGEVFVSDSNKEGPSTHVPTEVLRYSPAGALLKRAWLPIEAVPQKTALLVSGRGRVFLVGASETSGLSIWALQ